MPAPAPFASPNTAAAAANANANNALFPALYLYPLNDTWAPKHISLTNQHTKIGRQTSSKTAPGERNGFFDSKVLSRQHAEVWEDGGKIFIKDVKSSNGTFINGERLSSEGHESDPFELKSDDIVEFGIDIVGEDNKTIIHHKVAARVVCVFSEQDVQVAARAEQHQQQQHQQQQHQFLQQQQQQQQQGHPHQQQPGGPMGVGVGAGPSGINGGMPVGVGPNGGGPQNFPFAQRRPQLGQGLGSMGGMRPPGKTGLSFDVILSRLQGEVQKSRETGAELTSLTSAMSEIHDTLGGAVPANLPPFPAHLPPVRPPPEALPLPASSSASPEQPPANPPATVSAAVVVDLQSQLRDTQSSLANHLDKVRAIEGVLAEQELMKREVSTLREMMDERRREIEEQKAVELERERQHEMEQQHEEADHETSGDDDDDDDARSVATVGPHELESVLEEDEEQLAEDMKQTSLALETRAPPDEDVEETSASAPGTEEENENIDGLVLGRPRTPEPGGFDLPYVSRSAGLAQRRLSSPQSQSLAFQYSSSPHPHTEDVYEQVSKLSKQVSGVIALTASLEAQHETAQSTIQALESKVAVLEGLLRSAEEALERASNPPPPASDEAKEPAPEPAAPVEASSPKSDSSLLEKMAIWKKAVEGQWTNVQEEWSHERERLLKAQEEWEARARLVDVGLEKMMKVQQEMAVSQQQLQHERQLMALAGPSHLPHGLAHAHQYANGDAQLKHNGGLVTPPSPRSESSDSGRSPRRKKKRSASVGSIGSGSGRSRRSSGSLSDHEHEDADAEEGLSSSLTEEDILAGKNSKHHHVLGQAIGAATAVGSLGAAAAAAAVAARSLATPEPSVYKLGSSVNSLDSSSASGSPQAAKDHPLSNSITTTRSNDDNSDAMASLLLFFECTQRVLLMLFWSVLSFLSLLLVGSVAVLGGVSVVARRVWTWFLLRFPLDSGLRRLPQLRRLLSSSSSSPSSTTLQPEMGSTTELGVSSKHTSDPTTMATTTTTANNINVQAAVGVVLLSVAAAAVFWKIKPE